MELIGDGPENSDRNDQSYEDWKHNVGGQREDSSLPHPEGSFMAFLNDTSEADVMKLIKDFTFGKGQNDPTPWTLDTILPEIREQIWKRLPYSDLPNIRATCRKFHHEISNEIGIQLYFVDSDDQSLTLALTTSIKKLAIIHMGMSLGALVPAFPFRLEELSIRGCVSQDSIHQVLSRCPNIHTLEIDHGTRNYSKIKIEDECDNLNIFQDWTMGNLLKSEPQIRYSYGLFSKLRNLRFRSSGNEMEYKKNLLINTLLPLLNCLQSPGLSSINIVIFLTPEDSKILTDAIFKLFLRHHSLKSLHLFEMDSSHQTDLDPVPNVDQNYKSSQYDLKFGDYRPVPQFHSLKLEMSRTGTGFFDWLFLLDAQKHLRTLVWDVGGHYWTYSVEAIKKSAKTLTSLTLRSIRCVRMDGQNNILGSPVPLQMSNFHEFIVLKSLHLIGMDLSSDELSGVELLPQSIENLQIESFHIEAEQLMIIHRTLPGLKFFSVNHWNRGRENFLSSLKIIAEMINQQGKYKALNFLEKSMYKSVEELLEMNQLLSMIKDTAQNNFLQVDNVTGDNGVGFILVIGQDNRKT